MATLFEMLQNKPRAAGDISGIARGVASALGTKGLVSEEDRVLEDKQKARTAADRLVSRQEQMEQIKRDVDLTDEKSLLAAAQAMLQFDAAQAAILLQRSDALRNKRQAQLDQLQPVDLLAPSAANAAGAASAQASQAQAQAGAFGKFIAANHPDLAGFPPAEAMKLVQQREKDAAAGERTATQSGSGSKAKPPEAKLPTMADVEVLAPFITAALDEAGLEGDSNMFGVGGADNSTIIQLASDIKNLQRTLPIDTPIQQVAQQAIANMQAKAAPNTPAEDGAAVAKAEATAAWIREKAAAGWRDLGDGTWLSPDAKTRYAAP